MLFDSGVLTNTSPVVSINVSVAGVQTLTLVATNGVAGSIDYDHADWAGARLLSSAAQVPVAPSGLIAVTWSTTQVNLSWTNNAPAVSGSIIQRSINGTTWTQVGTTAAGVTTYFDKTAAAGTAYSYRVLATNAAGNSLPSNVAAATTLSASAAVTNLSALTWVSATAGWNTVQKNTSIVGNTLTLGNVTYATGLGTHAASQIVYNLAGGYTNFISDVGIDAEENGRGTGHVDFQVVGDGKVLFDSGVLTNSSPIVSINVNVTGVQTLTLLATNGIANDIDYDHSDWAGAKLVVAPMPPVGMNVVSAARIETISASSIVNAVVPTVQIPWVNASIGDVGQLGDASGSSSSMTIAGAGSGVGGTADALDYVYQSLNGNGTIVAHLDTTQTADDQAGVMIREALGAGAKEAAVVLKYKGASFIHRNKTGGLSAAKSNKKDADWVKLVRKGNTFTAYDSTDGMHWHKVGSSKLKMNADVEIGLAVASGTKAAMNSSVFSDIAIG